MKAEERTQMLAEVDRYAGKGSAFSRAILHKAVETAVEAQQARREKWGGWYLGGPEGTTQEAVLNEDQIYNVLYQNVSFGITVTLLSARLKEIMLDDKLSEAAPGLKRDPTRFDGSNGHIRLGVRQEFCTKLFRRKQAEESMEGCLYEVQSYGGSVHYGQTVKVKVRKGQNVSKAVLKAVESSVLGAGHKKQWQIAMERFGQLWAANSGDYRVFLSINPLDFLGMGMWGENSCYRAGSEQEMSKLVLMNAENAVVLKIMSGSADPSDKPVARAWGFWLDGEGLIVTNLYQMYWPQVIPMLKAAVSDWLGRPIKAAGEQVPGSKGIRGTLLKDFGVYTNGDTHGFGDDVAGMVKKLQKTKVLWTLEICPRCRRAADEESLHGCEAAGCGVRQCENCTVEARNERGETIRLCRDCANNLETRHCMGCDTQVYFMNGAPAENGCRRCADWWCNECSDEAEINEDGLCKTCDEYKKRMEARARGEDGPWEKIEGCECAACMATAA